MLNPKGISGLYVHLPFCHKICPFCTFPTVKDAPQLHQQYTHLLCTEIQLNHHQATDSKISSVYFGGGTPSRLSPGLIQQIKTQITTTFPNAEHAEWAFELNPEDCNTNYCRSLYELGFKRLSLGVQSFQNSCLKKLGRVHTAQQAFEAIESIQAAGFKNFNLDFLYGYQGTSDFIKDLKVFCSINPPHLSAYCLEINEDSRLPKKFTQWQNEHQPQIQHQYQELVRCFEEVGIQQYELSNFAQAKCQSAQNLVVWQRKNYLGFGLGSHSFIQQQRFYNTEKLNLWQTALKNQQLPTAYTEELGLEQIIDEIILVSLRLKKGLDLNQLYRLKKLDYQTIWHSWLQPLQQRGWLQQTGTKLCLQGLGLLYAADITTQLCTALQPYLANNTTNKKPAKALEFENQHYIMK